jgi:hypothetical protein
VAPEVTHDGINVTNAMPEQNQNTIPGLDFNDAATIVAATTAAVIIAKVICTGSTMGQSMICKLHSGE